MTSGGTPWLNRLNFDPHRRLFPENVHFHVSVPVKSRIHQAEAVLEKHLGQDGAEFQETKPAFAVSVTVSIHVA